MGRRPYLTLVVMGNYGAFLFLTYILHSIDRFSPLVAGVGFFPLTAINGIASTQIASRLLARLPLYYKTGSPDVCRVIHLLRRVR